MQLMIAVVLTGLAMTDSTSSAPRVPSLRPTLSVCLMMSPALSMDVPMKAAVMAEMNAVWQPHGVAVRHTSDYTESCDRLISVRSDVEARPEDASNDTALAWVPFVNERARRLIFLRLHRARVLVESLSPGTRPAGLTQLLIGKLVGRSLAHEIGHVLLNSTRHTSSGLMRARYRANDVLRDPPSAYTLDDEQRHRLDSTLTVGKSVNRR
jgi:hypothetical protein